VSRRASSTRFIDLPIQEFALMTYEATSTYR